MMKISPSGLCATLILHGSIYLVLTMHPHHVVSRSHDAMVVTVALPITPPPPPVTPPTPIPTKVIPVQVTTALPDSTANNDDKHYYVQDELSQPVTVVTDSSKSVSFNVTQVVTLRIYINRQGSVDDVIVEDSPEGNNIPQDQQRLLRDIFKKMQFTAGLRGSKVVNSVFRIELTPIPLTIIRPY